MLEYASILILAVLAAGVALFMLFANRLFGPRRADPVKFQPFECGVDPISTPAGRLPVHFYVAAMLFVVFDVELVFLFPWAIIYDKLALFGLAEMLVFIGILVVGYYYAWRKGALEWA